MKSTLHKLTFHENTCHISYRSAPLSSHSFGFEKYPLWAFVKHQSRTRVKDTVRLRIVLRRLPQRTKQTKSTLVCTRVHFGYSQVCTHTIKRHKNSCTCSKNLVLLIWTFVLTTIAHPWDLVLIIQVFTLHWDLAVVLWTLLLY